MATIRYRKNSIASLCRQSSLATSHQEKEAVLWNAYKERLGVSAPVSETSDYAAFVPRVEGLASMSASFSEQEIDSVVAAIPGPHGFTGLFLKTCWPIIKFDFYKLC
jgi:hypothetical protein